MKLNDADAEGEKGCITNDYKYWPPFSYYRSSSSSDLAEFYETSQHHGIAVMDDGEDISVGRSFPYRLL